MSNISQYYLLLFRQSLQRVTGRAGFYDGFYNSFMSQSEEIAEFFLNKDRQQIKHKLEESLKMLAETAESLPGTRLYMEMLGRIHRRLKVQRKHFDLWEQALLETVKVYDDQYNSQILAAWLDVIEEVVSIMYPSCVVNHSSKSEDRAAS
ncbi:MAG: globin [Candidatus Thiodiazotropha sp.]|jgi:hemoglobin-like flavoprotein